MVTFSKKTLCLALCALAAGNAMAEDWWYGNSASVSSSGPGSDAYADAGHKKHNSARGAAATVSVASALANDMVQGSNTISSAGAVAEGVGKGSEAKADVSATYRDTDAYTGNYHGGTYSNTDSDADAYFNYNGYTNANGDGDFYADGYGEGIVGAMGGEASVAIAQESREGWYGRLEGGSAGIGIARSKGRQGKDDWYSREALLGLDHFLDEVTTDEYITGAIVAMQAGIGLSGALPGDDP